MGTHFDVDSSGYVNVYTDVSCLDTGTPEAKAGIGVWFGENSRFNVSAPVVGPADISVAEIQAMTKAAQVAYDAGFTKLRVHTNSKKAIESDTERIPKSMTTGWINGVGNLVVHKAELQKLDSVLKRLTVEYTHVSAHTRIYGNEMADQLACEGAKQYKRN